MSNYDDAFSAAFGKGAASTPSEYDDVFTSVIKSSKTKQAAEPEKAKRVEDFGGNLRFATPFGTVDTGVGLPQSFNKGLASLGSGFADYGFAFAKPEAVDEKRRFDAQLNSDNGGKFLNFVGKAAPAMALPGTGIVGGMVAGGTLGLMEPVGTGESRTSNVMTNAALGGVIPAAVSGVKALARPNAETARLAQSALDQGVPVGISDITKNRGVKAFRSVLDDLPFIGGIGDRANNAKQAGFDTAVARVVGESDRLTPDVMAAAKTRIGGELNKVWDNNALKVDQKFITDINRIVGEAKAKLNPEQAATLERQLINLKDKAVQGQNGWEIPGSFANNWQSELRMIVDGEQGLSKKLLGDLRKTTLDAFNRGVSGADAAALSKAKTQYGAFKALEPIVNKAEAGVAGRTAGEINPALLSGRIAENYGSASRSPFGDLPQIGSQFLVNRTPQTGGSPRAFLQNVGIGSALTSGGGGVGAVLAGAPGAAFGVGATALGGAALEKLLSSPSVAQSVLTPKVMRGLLDNPEFSPAMIELMKRAMIRSPLAAPGLLSVPALE